MNHSPNTEIDRYIEITLQQTLATSRNFDDQYSSNAANDTFHSVGEEQTPHRQQLVPVTPHVTTEFETSVTEASSATMVEDKLASQQQQPQPHIDRDSSSETKTSVSTSDCSTAEQQYQQSHMDCASSSETSDLVSPSDHSTPTT